MKDKPLFTLIAVYLLGTLLFVKPDIIFNIDLGKPVLNIKQVGLKMPDRKRVALYNDQFRKVKSALGKPDFISNNFSEGDEKTTVVLHYKNDKLYIKENVLDTYEIVDSRIAVGKKCGPTFKVGDHVSAANAYIPIKYMQNYKLTADLILDDGSNTGHFIQIQINPSDSKIKSIKVISH